MHDLYESDHLNWVSSTLLSLNSKIMRCGFTSCTTITSRFQLEQGPLSAGTEKTACISQRHHWFPREMTSEQRLQKFHTDDASLPRSGWCRVISMEFLRGLFLRRRFAGNQWWRREMSAGFGGCLSATLSSQSHYWIIHAISMKFIPFTTCKNRSNAT